ncbi:8486_t:CDS:2, partial [Scutellospora calospora]
MKCDRCKLDKSNETFESLKTNKRKNANTYTKLKTCVDCRNQISANNKLKKREQKNKSIKENQENAIAPEDLVDFIFNTLPANYDYDEYLFEERFLIILESLLNNVDTNSDDQVNKEVAQYIVNLISKADRFSWIYHKCSKLKDSVSFVYYCNCHEELKNKKARVANISNQIHNLVAISIYHYLHLLPEAIEVSSQIHDFIINHNLLIAKKFATKEYKLANDQLESARRYLENNLNFKLLYQDQHSLAFITPLLFILPSKATKTIIVDSTYRTNCLKFELFAVLKVIDSAEFLLSYFFLEPKYLYEIREENAFANLPEDIHTIIKNLNSFICKIITSSLQDDIYEQNDNQVHKQDNNQVYKQESVM